MPSEAVNVNTREEWRELGFFYDRDDAARRWRLVGSRKGLRRFARLLREYSANPRNVRKSEHSHFGPYMYLKVMTWTEPGVDRDSIHGTPEDLTRLAQVIEDSLDDASPGSTISLASRYAADCAFVLDLEVQADDFDPVLEDPCLE